MKTFVLILLLTNYQMKYADTVAITSVLNFTTKEECEKAGNVAKVALGDVKFACVEQTIK